MLCGYQLVDRNYMTTLWAAMIQKQFPFELTLLYLPS